MIIFRYITQQLLMVWLAISSILLTVLLSSRFINYFNEAAAGNMRLPYLFAIMFYRIPGFLEIIMPLAFFLAILIVHGRLHAESEMVILENAGMGSHRLLGYTCGAGLVVFVLTGLLSLWLTPVGMKKTEETISLQNSLKALDMIQAGVFEKQNNGVYYIEHLSKDKRCMNNVFVVKHNAENSDQRMSVFMSEAGRVDIDRQHRYIILEKGYRYDITPGETGGRILKYDNYGILVKNSPIAPVTAEETLSSRALWQVKTVAARAQWQWRLSLLLMVPVAIMIALPLSRVSPRQGRYFKLLPGLLVYLIYLSLLMSLQGSIKHGSIAVFPGLYGVNALFFLLGLLLFYGSHIKRFILRSRQ